MDKFYIALSFVAITATAILSFVGVLSFWVVSMLPFILHPSKLVAVLTLMVVLPSEEDEEEEEYYDRYDPVLVDPLVFLHPLREMEIKKRLEDPRELSLDEEDFRAEQALRRPRDGAGRLLVCETYEDMVYNLHKDLTIIFDGKHMDMCFTGNIHSDMIKVGEMLNRIGALDL